MLNAGSKGEKTYEIRSPIGKASEKKIKKAQCKAGSRSEAQLKKGSAMTNEQKTRRVADTLEV